MTKSNEAKSQYPKATAAETPRRSLFSDAQTTTAAVKENASNRKIGSNTEKNEKQSPKAASTELPTMPRNEYHTRHANDSNKNTAATLLTVNAPAGRLGLELDNSHVVKKVLPWSTFCEKIFPGDRLVEVFGINVTKLTLKELVTLLSTTASNPNRVFTIERRVQTPGAPTNRNVEKKATDNLHLQKKVSVLKAYGIPTDNTRNDDYVRRKILSELISINEKYEKKNATTNSYLIRIPFVNRLRRPKNGGYKPKMDHSAFRKCPTSKVLLQVVQCFAGYCEGTDDEAADLILHYLAKRFPHSYIKNTEMAYDLHKKWKRENPTPLEIPPDYQSYDGTADYQWNLDYMELLKYKAKHGHCLVPAKDIKKGKTIAGTFCYRMRQWRKANSSNLTPTRIELLESIGFAWVHDPNRKKAVPGGDPRHCRAVVAKMMYPQLLIREALYMGGYTEQELNEVADKKHAWRTGYSKYKDSMHDRIKNLDKQIDRGAKKQIERLLAILKGETENKEEEVFGEQSCLLPGFLDAAERLEHRNNNNDTTRESEAARTKRGLYDSEIYNASDERPSKQARLDGEEQNYAGEAIANVLNNLVETYPVPQNQPNSLEHELFSRLGN